MLEYVPSSPTLFRAFNIKCCWSLSNSFYISIKSICIVVLYLLTYFETSLNFWHKASLIMVFWYVPAYSLQIFYLGFLHVLVTNFIAMIKYMTRRPLSYSIHGPRDGPAHSKLGLLYQPSIKNMHQSFVHRPIWGVYFISWSSLLPNDFGLVSTDRKLATTYVHQGQWLSFG